MPSSLDKYEVLDTIGSGTFGTCKKVKRKRDGMLFVWKELYYGCMNSAEKALLVSEVNLLRELKHEHIVRYHDRIIDRAESTLYIIMEYCEGGDLSSVISAARLRGESIPEAFIWQVAAQLISALQYCHSFKTSKDKKVLHRDIKPANVFLDSNRRVCLGDFGLARELLHETSFAKTQVGTPYYMSPEQLSHQRYNEKSDIWALGCMIHEMCTLRPTFNGSNTKELYANICAGIFSRIPSHYSDSLYVLICSMLVLDESKRASAESLCKHRMVQVTLHTETQEKNDSKIDEMELKLKALRVKEITLNELESHLKNMERRLKQKERDLEIREKAVIAKENALQKPPIARKPLFDHNMQDVKLSHKPPLCSPAWNTPPLPRRPTEGKENVQYYRPLYGRLNSDR